MISSSDKLSQDGLFNRLKLFIKSLKEMGVDPESVTGLSKQARANYKSRGNTPASATLTVWALEYGLSIDWLLTGHGNMFRGDKGQPPFAMDRLILLAAVEDIEGLLQEMGLTVAPTKKSELVGTVYDYYERYEPADRRPACLMRLIKAVLEDSGQPDE